LNVPKSQVIPALKEALNDPDSRSKAYAADMLLDLKVPAKDVVAAYEVALRDPNAEVRKEVMEIIHKGKNHPVELAPALLRAMKRFRRAGALDGDV